MKSNNLKNIVILLISIIIIVGLLYLIGYTIYGAVMKNKKDYTNPIVTMELADGKIVKMELYPEYAPNTVANFVDLINQGYYDGLTFHRAVEDFMIQGGDKEGTGQGKADETIEGEFSQNGFEENTLRLERGVLAMARSDYSSLGKATEGYNSAYSQFFVLVANNISITGGYCGFGKVIEGMEYIDEIVKVRAIQEDKSGEKIEKAEEIPAEEDTRTDEQKTADEAAAEQAQLEKQPKIVKMTVDQAGIDYLAKYGAVKRNEAFDVNEYLSETYNFQ